MNTNQCDIGLIGLGVMGENLALNMESKGFSVAVFNRTTEVTEKFVAERGQGKKYKRTRTLEEFVGAVKKPRIAMMMVKAGPPVDSVIGQLAPLLEKGDVIIDGGNSLFTDTSGGTRIAEHRNSLCRHGRIRRRRRRAQGTVAHARWFARVVGNHRANFPQDRCASGWRTVLSIYGTRRRRSLREDGAQRH